MLKKSFVVQMTIGFIINIMKIFIHANYMGITPSNGDIRSCHMQKYAAPLRDGTMNTNKSSMVLQHPSDGETWKIFHQHTLISH